MAEPEAVSTTHDRAREMGAVSHVEVDAGKRGRAILDLEGIGGVEECRSPRPHPIADRGCTQRVDERERLEVDLPIRNGCRGSTMDRSRIGNRSIERHVASVA